ncbi:MAG: MBOAT family protein [Oscillospiraceae bacterium]|nr:MBOAT family protein [Oscillospiraceae bacterium]
MVFSSNVFLFFFLPAALALYYLAPRRYRNTVLLLVSLVFYGWGEPVYLLLMLFTIALNYGCGLWIARRRAEGRSAKPALIWAAVLNLGLLAWFKYAGFLARSLRLLPGLGALPIPAVALPIGISFYIFQSMSYTIDVYRGDAPVQRDILRFGAYVSMFPQLIAGPIVRYRDVAAQLEERRETSEQFASGVTLFILGLSKKLLLANPVGALWEALQAQPGTLSAWAGMFAYTLQIYFDFSGYSDMAIGLGRLFGFEFLKNFDYPYIAQSVTEFWRRWHISLSTWFREYLYIPLGGNRRGLPRQLLNLLIVWLLTGLWHGASWNFVLWGLYYALLLMGEKLLAGRFPDRLPRPLRHLLLVLIVSFGWMLFYFESSPALLAFLKKLVLPAAASARARHLLLGYLPLLLFAALAATPIFRRLADKLLRTRGGQALRLLVPALLLLLCVAALASQSYNPFIYFRF